MFYHLLSQGFPSLLVLTFGGCCSNVFFFEKLLHIESRTGTLITFTQYLFITVTLFIYLNYTSPSKSAFEIIFRPSSVPLSRYFLSTTFLSLTSYLSNFVFRFNLSVSVHVIFRSSGTIFTVLLGWLFWNKKYTVKQISGTVIISFGMILFTMGYTNHQKRNENLHLDDWFVGVLILLFSTIIGSITALFNETTYKKYSKTRSDWIENTFYSHLYGLPFFLLVSEPIWGEFHMVSKVSKFWDILFINLITQIICVSGVNMIAIKTSALSLGIILLVRRFISLILSIVLFGNSLGIIDSVGSLFVFAGAIIYIFGASESIGQKTMDSKNKEISKERKTSLI